MIPRDDPMWAARVAAEAARLRRYGVPGKQAWETAASVDPIPCCPPQHGGPTHRERMLELMSDGRSWTASQLAEVLGRRMIDVSTSLRKAERAGLVVFVGKAQIGAGHKSLLFCIADAMAAK